MQTPLHPCYLLHQRSYRETSSILDVFSREQGRINIIARGIKSKNKNNLQGVLQPCQKLMLAWSGKGELPKLTKAELSGDMKILSSKKIMIGFYINELIVRLLHKNEPDFELFDIYEATLLELANTDAEQVVLRRFEKHLLQSIGYGLVLDYDNTTGKPVEPNQTYFYSLETGPCINAPKQGGYVELKGETLLALDNELFNTETSLKEAKKLIRYILNIILGNKPLLSRELFQSYIKTYN